VPMRSVAAHRVPVGAPVMRPVGEEAAVAERGPAAELRGGGPGLRPAGGMVLGLNRTGTGDGSAPAEQHADPAPEKGDR
jgi:hypothetical protein